MVAGETAEFSGPSAIHNVLARVTGGTPSGIDGTLRCTIPCANVYLINPAGVTFGPNASLDVSGSFAVSTAGVVKLADGGLFAAANPAGSVLTTAPPSAFGFLGPAASAVGLAGGTLKVSPGKVLSVVGGNIRIADGTVLRPAAASIWWR